MLGTQDEFTSGDLAAWAPVTAYHFRVLGPTDFGYAPALCRKLLAQSHAQLPFDQRQAGHVIPAVNPRPASQSSLERISVFR